MPAEVTTKSLNLGLGTDEAINDNWRKLDAAIARIARTQTIMDNLVVRGDLEVDGNATITGDLTAGSLTTAGNLSAYDATLNNLTLAGGLHVNGQPCVLPPGCISPSNLATNIATRGLWVGTANPPVTIPLDGSIAQLASVVTDATEQPQWTELLFANLTLQYGTNADPAAGGANCVIRVDLTRGAPPGVVQQSRTLGPVWTKAGFVQVPLTMVRLGFPVAGSAQRWNLNGSVTSSQGSPTVTSQFAQLHVLQLV